MALDANELGYFIQQVGLAALSFGVSQADATAAGTALQTLFGYRCSPPANIVGGPQLESICDAKSCPLDPKADCGQYPWWGVSYPPKVAPQCKGMYKDGDQNAPDSSHMDWEDWQHKYPHGGHWSA